MGIGGGGGASEAGRHAIGDDGARTGSAGQEASQPTTATVRSWSENTFHSAATRASADVTGAWPPEGRSTMKSRMRCPRDADPWRSSSRRSARGAGCGEQGADLSALLEPREARQPSRGDQRIDGQPVAPSIPTRTIGRGRPALSEAEVAGLASAAADRPGPGREAAGAEPAAGVSLRHSRRGTPGFPAAQAASASSRGREPPAPGRAARMRTRSHGSVVRHERVAINWNAPLVFLLAGLSRYGEDEHRETPAGRLRPRRGYARPNRFAERARAAAATSRGCGPGPSW